MSREILRRIAPVLYFTASSDCRMSLNSSSEGRAVRIEVNSRAAQIAMSFLHEIGHFLEHKGIRLANFELLEGFHRAAKQSESYRLLLRLFRSQTVVVTLPNGRRVRYHINRKYLAYLLAEA